MRLNLPPIFRQLINAVKPKSSTAERPKQIYFNIIYVLLRNKAMFVEKLIKPDPFYRSLSWQTLGPTGTLTRSLFPYCLLYHTHTHLHVVYLYTCISKCRGNLGTDLKVSPIKYLSKYSPSAHYTAISGIDKGVCVLCIHVKDNHQTQPGGEGLSLYISQYIQSRFCLCVPIIRHK